MAQAMPKPNRAQGFRRAVKGIPHAREFQGHGDVFKRRHGRYQVKGLEDNAKPFATKTRQRIFIHRADIGAVNQQGA